MLLNLKLAIILMSFLVFTLVKDKIDYVVLEIWQDFCKFRSSQVVQEGEKMLNIWLLMSTICIGIVWLIREKLAVDLSEHTIRQRSIDEMLNMQMLLMSNISRKVITLENQFLSSSNLSVQFLMQLKPRTDSRR